MIQLQDILTPARCLTEVAASSKKRVLEQAAQLLASDLPEIASQSIFDSLLAREKLGSTGFAGGIAIPHCRLPDCTAPIAALLHLAAAVDFDAEGGAPVDLLFILLVPPSAAEEHLELLRQIATLLSRADLCQRLREARTGAMLYSIISEAQQGAGRCN